MVQLQAIPITSDGLAEKHYQLISMGGEMTEMPESGSFRLISQDGRELRTMEDLEGVPAPGPITLVQCRCDVDAVGMVVVNPRRTSIISHAPTISLEGDGFGLEKERGVLLHGAGDVIQKIFTRLESALAGGTTDVGHVLLEALNVFAEVPLAVTITEFKERSACSSIERDHLEIQLSRGLDHLQIKIDPIPDNSMDVILLRRIDGMRIVKDDVLRLAKPNTNTNRELAAAMAELIGNNPGVPQAKP